MLTFNVDDVLRRIMPAVWAVLMFVVLSLNFWAGWKVDGLLIGMAFVCVALLGAFAAANVRQAPRVMKPVLGLVIVFQLMLGQWAGWQAIGLNLAQNTAALDTEADLHHANRDELKRAQERRAALGTPRPVDAIAAERDLECKRTSRTYKDGRGPRCTALMSEEAAAQEAASLDQRIPKLKAQLEAGGQLTDGNAPFSVAMKLSSVVASFASGKPVVVGRDEVLFGFKIFFVFLLEFLATCGPMLLQMLEREAPQPVVAGPRKRITYLPRPPLGAPDAYFASAPGAADDEGAPSGDQAAPQMSDSGKIAPHTASAAPSSLGASGADPHPRYGALGAHAQPGETASSAVSHGAPINVNFYGADRSLVGASGADTAPAPAAPLADKVSDRNVAKLRAVQAEAFAPDVPDTPVDRSNVNQMLDGLLAFKAACLSDQGGACVAASVVYKVYAQWAGPRAVAEPAFHTLFEAAAHVPLKDIGGIAHYMGVRLRETRASA